MAIVATVFLFMAIITAISVQKRNYDRLNIHLDGKFAFGLFATAAEGLKIGQTLSLAEIATLQDKEQFEKAKETALNLLSYRPRSTVEVQRHLYKKKFDELLIEQVIERLQAVSLLDDDEFARYWVEQRETFKPRSKMALRHELRQKGLSRAVIDDAVTAVDEKSAARRAANKKAYRWENLPEKEFRLKLGGYLQRQGFSYEIVRQIIEEAWQTVEEK